MIDSLNEVSSKPEYDSKLQMHTDAKRTLGHKWMYVAALLGGCFVVTHLVTIAVTCTVEGFNWGFNAWMLDSTGFLAGLFFATQCWLSSRSKPEDFRSGNFWIFIWALITFIVRIVDVLMLLGIVKWSAIYITPSGAVLVSNVISEIVFGMAFTICALVASATLLKSPNGKTQSEEDHESG